MEAGLGVGADGVAIVRIRIRDHAWYARCQQAVDELPDETGAMASPDHVGYADELVDAACPGRVRAYAKAGFQSERVVETPDGPALLMVRNP